MSEEHILSRRERRARARKAQILDGAAQVFAEKGYHAATTREIAEAADMSEGSIYHYFDSKEDLLIEIMGRLTVDEAGEATGTLEDIQNSLTGDVRPSMKSILKKRQEFAIDKQPVLRTIVSEILINKEFAKRYYEEILKPNVEAMERHIRSRISRGEIREVNPALSARFFIAANYGLFELLFLGDPLLGEMWGTEELLDAIVSFYLDGLESQADTEEPGQ
jgi:AcrR family transcriptional regulator